MLRCFSAVSRASGATLVSAVESMRDSCLSAVQSARAAIDVSDLHPAAPGYWIGAWARPSRDASKVHALTSRDTNAVRCVSGRRDVSAHDTAVRSLRAVHPDVHPVLMSVIGLPLKPFNEVNDVQQARSS